MNINRRGLHLAMRKFEENRATSVAERQNDQVAVAQPLHNDAETPLAVVQDLPPVKAPQVTVQ